MGFIGFRVDEVYRVRVYRIHRTIGFTGLRG